MTLAGKHILITGSARRIGRALALAVAAQGGAVILHHGSSPAEAEQTRLDIQQAGGSAHILQTDLSDLAQVPALIEQALSYGPLYALVNNAAIFEPLSLPDTTLDDWQRNMAINLTAPFLLSQAFAAALPPGRTAASSTCWTGAPCAREPTTSPTPSARPPWPP
jgi:NAD(P)-dependent dehydrogenase (short-subunit alcohol dehydrogenase family)